MQYIKPHLSPELRAQITPQAKRDRKMTAAGVFLLLGSAVLAFNVWPKGDDGTAAINNKLESIGTQTQTVSFGGQEKQVLGLATTSAEPTEEPSTPAKATSSENPKTENVPATSSDQYTSYTVKSGDTLFNISQEYNIKWDLIAQINDLSEPYMLHGGQILKIPQATTSKLPGKIYTIVKGDTLASIAKGYNITVDDIIAVNPNLQKSDLISIGQVIKLP
ncbi:MAG: LysM peptidoglycan-binding domain-containing protein [Candidatus Doudnabacteria bacterium]|nr:LysM peptidoglycan-binding domain-containing protein [Candidatus Doudnabacteria bacterium]